MRNEKSILKLKETFQLLINHLRYYVYEIDDYVDILTEVFQMTNKYDPVLFLKNYNGELQKHIGYIDNKLL